MTSVKLPHLNRMTDRHGKVRLYFRRDGKRVPLPGPVGSPEFMRAYQAASQSEPPPVAAGRDATGTFSALIASRYQSAKFKQYTPGTRRTYRSDAERFRAKHGRKLVVDLEPRHVEAWMDALADTPAAANKLRQFLRQLMKHAKKIGLRRDNPMLETEKLKPKNPDGYPQWEHWHLAQFRARWPIGSKPRLALELLLCTAARRSDAVRLGPQDIHGGAIRFRAQKTGEPVGIPISAELREALEAMPVRPLRTFLATQYGKPFTGGGFYNWFTERAREAGIPKGLGVHGLRKSAACHLAEQGYTVPEIAALGGWKTLALVQHYTRGVDRALMLKNALARIGEKPQTGA
jgi:integrase